MVGMEGGKECFVRNSEARVGRLLCLDTSVKALYILVWKQFLRICVHVCVCACICVYTQFAQKEK